MADRTLIPYSPSIEVEYIAPPIPLRDFDYRANFASYEPGDCLGYGPTPDAAGRDLIDVLLARDECSVESLTLWDDLQRVAGDKQ